MAGGMLPKPGSLTLAERAELSRSRGDPAPAQHAAAGSERKSDDLVATTTSPRDRAGGGGDGAVGYQNPRSEEPGDGVPVTLTVEQIGADPVRRGAEAVAVFAWVPWTDGRYRAVVAFAGEWTSSAVHLRWRESTGLLRDVWVWAAGVRRRAPDDV